MYSLYWAITTLATVGYGDFSAVNTAEAVWATIYMFFNLALGAYVLGTITLLVVSQQCSQLYDASFANDAVHSSRPLIFHSASPAANSTIVRFNLMSG